MTLANDAVAILIGLAAGVLSGLFGVGGGIAMTPGLSAMGLSPIVAVASPLPVIFPTAAVGAATYWHAGEVDPRAALWIALVGAPASAAGAGLTEAIDGRWLLLITAGLLAWQAAGILRGRDHPSSADATAPIPGARLAIVGVAAGLLSGLLGIGGGIVIVPALAGVLGMPLKRALGTSLLCVVVLVVPGTIVHAILGHLDLEASIFLAIGAIPGARIGATLALGTRERTLRTLVGTFLGVVAVWYAIQQVSELARP